MTLGRDQYVGALQVPVHDSAIVRMGQRVCDVERVAQNVVERQSAFGNDVRQPAARDQLHRDVHAPVAVADIVNRAHRRVVERGRELGFLDETRTRGVVGQRAGREYFQSDVAIQFGVVSAIDFAHAAGANGGHDLIGPEASTNRNCHGFAPILSHLQEETVNRASDRIGLRLGNSREC